MNKSQWRIETAHNIFLACRGNIDKAMTHEKMPYKTKKTVRRLAREHKWYQELDISRTERIGRLEEEDIERIHEAFIESGGQIRNSAQRTGFGRSTVSKYAKAGGWYEELIQIDMESLNRKAEQSRSLPLPNADNDGMAQEQGKEDEEEAIVQLRTLRRILFKAIIGHEEPEATDKSQLKIKPKTLSEAIKVLLDIDKRILEREEDQNIAIPVPYQNILARCAGIVEDESE